MMGQSEYNVLVDNRAASKITQGITTEVTGEGTSIAPVNDRMVADAKATSDYYGVTPNFTTLEEYSREFTRRGAAINLATFVGAGGVRNLVIGKDNRPATPAELAAMEAAVAQAMEQGALGVSTALLYVPGTFASTEEIIALARVAGRYGGCYITHQRDEGDDGNGGIDASLDEVFRIAREARIPAEVYHLKRPEGQLGPDDGDPASGSNPLARKAWTCRPISTRGPPAPTTSTPACPPGCPRAEPRRWWRASKTPRPGPASARIS